MEKILETRRVFETVKEQTWEIVWAKNPHYNADDAVEYARNGFVYPHAEYIEKEVPKMKRQKRSHIEYRIKCAHCGGTKGWVRRRDAKYCSSGCRNLAREKRGASNS